MTTSSMSLPPLDDVTLTLAGGIGEMPVARDFTAPSPLRAPMAAPLAEVAVSTGGEVSTLVEATSVNCPELRLYSARWITTRSVRGMDKVVGVLLGMATWLSAVSCRVLGNVGLFEDCAYQFPVVSASVRCSAGLLLSRVTVAGGGGAMTNTSCLGSRALFPGLRG